MNNNENITPVSEDEIDNIRVTLDVEDGTVECKILTIFDVDGQEYIALLPLDSDGNEPESGEIYLYRYFEDENGLPSIDNIVDDDEYEAVVDRFDEMQDEAMFNEMDD